MAVSRFHRYELQTIDRESARAFYESVLGRRFWSSDVVLRPLPERAATYVKARWLGHIGCRDLPATMARFEALGGKPLGPLLRGDDGFVEGVLRDPFGAVLALRSPPRPPLSMPVAWHLLTVADQARAFATYAELFNWSAAEKVAFGARGGHQQVFTWDASGQPAGSIVDIAGPSRIHPQWLFFFEVGDLDEALANVTAGGGKVLRPIETPRGDLVAPCDDPQGTAFGLFQAGPR